MFFKLSTFYFKLSILLLFYLMEIVLCLNPLSFRIVAPQTICKPNQINNNFTNITNLEQNNNISSINERNQIDNGAIAVSFQPRNGIKLKYRMQIFFKTLDTIQNRSQRRTLLLWKSIRTLEKRINVKDSKLISDLNILSINKSELVSGVTYFFQVVGVNEEGLKTSTKNFTLKYNGNNKKLRFDDSIEGINLGILGAEESQITIPYTVVAAVDFCNLSFHNYHYRWDLVKPSNIDEQIKKYLHLTSNKLTFPEYSLQPNLDYRIEVEVIESSDSKVLAKDFMDFVLIEPDILLTIVPTSILTGIKKPVIFEIQIRNYDMEKYPVQINWSCYKSKLNCSNVQIIPESILVSSNKNRCEIVFELPGEYEIVVKVSNNNQTRILTSNVTIISNVSVSYEFSNLPRLIDSFEQSLNISIQSTGLIPGCIGNWTNIPDKENGYESIDESQKKTLGSFYIKDVLRQFLSEVDDLGNSTSDYEATLTVPPLSSTQSKRYKFRLIINCTYEIDLNKNSSTMMSFFELVTTTNPQSIGVPLTIKPLNGSALSTVFQFTSGSAKRSDNDYPLLYKYYIQIDNYTLCLGSYYETFVINTILPYSDKEIKTFYNVCDTMDTCLNVKGPNIKVSLLESTFTQEEIKNRENEIINLFRRMNYADAGNLITMCLLTYKSYSEDIYENFKKFSSEILSQTINKLSEQATLKYYTVQEEIIQLFKTMSHNVGIMNTKDSELLGKLVDLMQTTSEDMMTSSNNSTDLRAKRNILMNRNKRDLVAEKIGMEDRSIVDTNFFEIALNLMEKFLKSINESALPTERLQIIAKISVLTEKLCANEKIYREIFYTSFIGITIEKMSGFQLFGKNFTIPKHYSLRQGYFTINLPNVGINRKKYYCLILMQFPEDYFSLNQKNIVYNVQLYELIGQKQKTKKIEVDNKNSIIALEVHDNFEKLTSCLMWESNEWGPKNCKNDMNKFKVKCSCKSFGYLKILDLNELLPVPTTMQPTDTTVYTTENFINSSKENDLNLYTDSTLPIQSSTPKNNEVSKKPLTNTKLNILTTVKSIITEISTKTTSAVSLKVKKTNSTTSTTTTTESNNKEKVTTASTVSSNYYILGSVAFLGLVGSMAIIFLIYYRRKQNASKVLNELDLIIEPRESKTGIAYATFYDEHLLKGEMPN